MKGDWSMDSHGFGGRNGARRSDREEPGGQLAELWWKLRLGWHENDYAIPAIANRLPYFLGEARLLRSRVHLARLYNPEA